MSNQQVYFKGIRKEIIKLIKDAKSKIKIAVAWITDEAIIKALEEVSDEGVNISIIFYDDKVNKKSLFEELVYSGARVRSSKNLMHNKFCIIDSNIVITGSYNWTVKAGYNNENILVTSGNYELAEKFESEFDTLFQTRCENIELELTPKQIWEEHHAFEEYYQNKYNEKTIFPYWYKDERDRVTFIENKKAEYSYFREAYFWKRYYENIKARRLRINQNLKNYKSVVGKVTGLDFEVAQLTTIDKVKNFDTLKNVILNQSKKILIEHSVKKGYTDYDYISCIDPKKKEIIEQHRLWKKFVLKTKKHGNQRAFYFIDAETDTNKIVNESFDVIFETQKNVVHVAPKGVVVEVENKGYLDLKNSQGEYSRQPFYEFLSFGGEIKTPHFNDYFVSGETIYLFEYPIFHIGSNDYRFSYPITGTYRTYLDNFEIIRVNTKNPSSFTSNEKLPFRYININELDKYQSKFAKSKTHIFLGDNLGEKYGLYLQLYRKIYENYDFVLNLDVAKNYLRVQKLEQILENPDDAISLILEDRNKHIKITKERRASYRSNDKNRPSTQSKKLPKKDNRGIPPVVYLTIFAIIAMSFTELGKIVIFVGIFVSLFGALHWMNNNP